MPTNRRQRWQHFLNVTSLLRRLHDHPSKCNFTYRQNLPIQQNRRNFLSSDAILSKLDLKNSPSRCNIVYFMTGKNHLKPFGVGADGSRRVSYLLTHQITKVFVEQPLASPGSANLKFKISLCIHLTVLSCFAAVLHNHRVPMCTVLQVKLQSNWCISYAQLDYNYSTVL